MQLQTVRIRNFRTIAEDVTFAVNNKCALIGINNVGKSNILNAIHLFFSLHRYTIINRRSSYFRSTDFPSFVTSGKTTINLMFSCQDTQDDEEVLEFYNQIKLALGVPIGFSRVISILLVFSETGRYAYQVFPNTKRPTSAHDVENVNNLIDEFFDDFFRRFAVHYLRSDKRVAEIYHELILPSVKQELAVNLSSVYETVKSSIASVNISINRYMADIGLSTFAIRLSAPDDVADLIQEIKFRIQDEDLIEGELEAKGMGVQSLAVTASMLWLQQFYMKNGRSVIWLIEEPEFFLHPSLMSAQGKIIDRLSKESSVLYTTHSLSFTPSDRNNIIGVKKEKYRTIVATFRNTYEATESLRRDLGLRLADFFNLSEFTIGVEGPTDKQYVEWFLALYDKDKAIVEHRWPLLRKAAIIDYGGVQPLQYFLQSMYTYIRRERVYVALFDSDDAGGRARDALQGYFDGKFGYSYSSAVDFVSIRKGYSIEGLFSDEIIKMCTRMLKGCFLPFPLIRQVSWNRSGCETSQSKVEVYNKLTERAGVEKGFTWAGRFIQVCCALEAALEKQEERLKGMSV